MTPAVTSSASKARREHSRGEGEQMNGSFVFIFRQGSSSLTEEEQKRRTEEVRDWATQHIKDGHGLDPRVLDNESLRLGDHATHADTEGQVIALNFIEATDFEDAVRIAKTHPGLRYGVRIEVRPWRDPRAQPAASVTAHSA
jgi:hypothetical protein